ncbi:MAG: hypothetical protein E7547_02305 [Ruminococcaceae bacterium]|nr:hypothetical protein [Oscillospiraceae bacterium]
MKKIKYVFSIVALLMIPFVLSSCSNWTVERYIYEYHREKYEAEDFLPTGFASYDSVYYNHDRKNLIVFQTNTMTVKAKYDDFYVSKKHEVEETYDFLTKPILSDTLNGHYLVPVTKFEYKGFQMRVADGGEYPKKFGIVGYNDETKEIAYLWFNDPDRDYICESNEDLNQAMIDFVDNNFKLN